MDHLHDLGGVGPAARISHEQRGEAGRRACSHPAPPPPTVGADAYPSWLAHHGGVSPTVIGRRSASGAHAGGGKWRVVDFERVTLMVQYLYSLLSYTFVKVEFCSSAQSSFQDMPKSSTKASECMVPEPWDNPFPTSRASLARGVGFPFLRPQLGLCSTRGHRCRRPAGGGSEPHHTGGKGGGDADIKARAGDGSPLHLPPPPEHRAQTRRRADPQCLPVAASRRRSRNDTLRASGPNLSAASTAATVAHDTDAGGRRGRGLGHHHSRPALAALTRFPLPARPASPRRYAASTGEPLEQEGAGGRRCA